MNASPIKVLFSRDDKNQMLAMIVEKNVYVCTYILAAGGEWTCDSKKALPLYEAAVKKAWDRFLNDQIKAE
jgi:hypothetical protein